MQSHAEHGGMWSWPDVEQFRQQLRQGSTGALQPWRACVMHNVDGFLVADAVPEPVARGYNKGVLVIQISGCDLWFCSQAPCPF